MASPRKSTLFQVESRTCYLSWVPSTRSITDNAVSFTDSNGSINIGRVKRSDHIIPGTLRNGVCRFFFEGDWHEERDHIEVLIDNFGAAQKALSWVTVNETDGRTLLSLNSEVGGEFPGGIYVIGRKKGSLDIVPIAVKEESRRFDKGHIVYEEASLNDIEVLESTYHKIVAVCPSAPCPEIDATIP